MAEPGVRAGPRQENPKFHRQYKNSEQRHPRRFVGTPQQTGANPADHRLRSGGGLDLEVVGLRLAGRALFLPDWSYGRMFVARLKPDGAAYKAETELFLSGAPLPITDILVNPRDGAMYFVTGGWRIQTGLYRVTYTGKESTMPAQPLDDGAKLRELRRRLEAFHGHPSSLNS